MDRRATDPEPSPEPLLAQPKLEPSPPNLIAQRRDLLGEESGRGLPAPPSEVEEGQVVVEARTFVRSGFDSGGCDRLAFELLEDGVNPGRHPAAWAAAPRLPAAYAALVEPSPDCELALGQTEPSPDGPEAARQGVLRDLRVVAQEEHYRPVVPGQGPCLPRSQVAGVSSRTPSFSARVRCHKAEVEPAFPDVVRERPGLARVTPWESGRSGTGEVQPGKRQRNSVRVAGWDIRSEGASARRPISRDTRHVFQDPSSTVSISRSRCRRSRRASYLPPQRANRALPCGNVSSARASGSAIAAGEERVTAMRLAEALQYRAYEARRPFAAGS